MVVILVAASALALVILAVAFWVIGCYNGLVARLVAVDNAWAQIDVQLKRRHDLIPQLVETVKGYVKHETGTLEAVTKARAAALAASTPGEHAAAEQQLSGALKGLFVVAESYPDLKASANFSQLQEQLGVTEDRIAYARQYYDDAVQAYNIATSTLPTAIIAGAMGFRHRDFFAAPADEHDAVQVRF
jgi:LemA protein